MASAQEGVPRLAPLDVLATAPLPVEVKSQLADQACVLLGHATEVDLVLAEQAVPGSARTLNHWLRQCREHWDSGKTGLLTVRQVHQAQQRDSKEGRVDLNDVVSALEENPELAMTLPILDKNPDWEALAKHGKLTREKDKATWIVRVPVRDYPEQLGGARYLGETARWLTLNTSHANWRDRRSRRLTHIRVSIEQTWPQGASIKVGHGANTS